jgi:hypothetical protein
MSLELFKQHRGGRDNMAAIAQNSNNVRKLDARGKAR